MTDMSKIDQRILDRMDKILALQKRAGTEAEALAAAAALNKLLEEHNLTVAEVERGGSAGGAVREKAAASGGMYEYQRQLWEAVAELYFCTYRRGGHHAVKRGKTRWRTQHLLIGRRVNTAAALATGKYLEETAERLCRERLELRSIGYGGAALVKNPQSQFFSTEAVAFREGLVDRVVEKLQERRQHLLDEAARKAAETAKRARESGRDGVVMSSALTLLDVQAQEEQGNYDFLHGEGAWARKLDREAAWARKEAAREAAQAAWDAAHPEEARQRAEEQREANRAYWARRSRAGTGGPSRADERRSSREYYLGRDAGERVGIDQQADHSKARRLTSG